MVLTVPTSTICSVELIATTAASHGLLMTQESGTLKTLSAAAKLKRLERWSLERAARVSTVASVVLTAASVTCPGRQRTQKVIKVLQLTADVKDPGEQSLSLKLKINNL